MRSSNKNMRTRYEGTIVIHGRRCSQGRISSIGHYVRLTRGWPTLSQATGATLSTHDSWPGPDASSVRKGAAASLGTCLCSGQTAAFRGKERLRRWARRISVCRKTQRVRDPRPTTHKSALKAVVFCPPAIARPTRLSATRTIGEPGPGPPNVPGRLIEPIGGWIEPGGIAGSSWLIRSARLPTSSFNAVGLGFLPRMAWSLYFASLVTSAGQIAGNLPGNIPPHIIIS